MRRWLFLVGLTVLCLSPSATRLSNASDHTALKMQVKRVFLDPSSRTPVVILESAAAGKFIPIWIGKSEATSIALELEHASIPRPNSHDLIRNILGRLGAVLHRITITDLRDNTYFAVMSLKLNDQDFEIDSRPSDAIAVALRMNAPIYASLKVLAKTEQMPSSVKEPEGSGRLLGFHIQDLTAELAGFLNLKIERGVLVADVERGSAASLAGFHRGDVIIRFNGTRVDSVAALESLLKGVKEPGSLEIEVRRGGESITMKLDLPS